MALLQDLLSASNDRHRAQLGHAMSLMCAKLPVAWASLTVLSPSGGSYQIVAQAMDGSLFQPFSSSWGKTNSSRLMAAASGSVHQSSLRTNQTATPSRQSSSGSMTPSMFAFQPVEFGLGDVQPVQGSNSSIEVMVLSGGQPLTALLPTGFTPGTAVFDQALLSLPSDWVPLCRDRGLRSLMCLPLLASNGAGACVGALSMGCTEPMDWQSQWWTPSLQLITGWAASALTQTRAMQRAAFFEALSTAPDLDSLAATVVHALPALFQDVSMPKVCGPHACSNGLVSMSQLAEWTP